MGDGGGDCYRNRAVEENKEIISLLEWRDMVFSLKY
jgi:hypothetical protein